MNLPSLLAPFAAICILGAMPEAAALTFVTEQHPPHNFLSEEGHAISGSSTDIIQEMLRRSGLQAQIGIYPWPRAYRMAQNSPETCVYTTARTPARESLFQWVGPLATAQWTLYTRADAPIAAKTLTELNGYIVGGYQDDAKSTLLKEQGFTIDVARNEEQGLRKLEARRIDLWVATSHTGPWLARKLDIRIKPVIVFGAAQLYAACNLNLPAADIDKMNQTLRTMQADGTLQRLISTYQ